MELLYMLFMIKFETKARNASQDEYSVLIFICDL